jgi:hydrogenase nickel incorporation protein HypA/HybF
MDFLEKMIRSSSTKNSLQKYQQCSSPFSNGQRATGNGQRATGNGQRATGNGQRATGKRNTDMHEMSIAMEILQIARDSIPADMVGARICRINLKVGRMSAVVPESLRFCFTVAADKTNAAGAELAIEEIPVQTRCSECGHQWTVDAPAFVCPACGSGGVEMLTGRELDIVSIEIAEEDGEDAHLE